MSSQPGRPRLVAMLWFIAAGLAFIATAISAIDDGEINWGTAAPGLFCLIMAIAALRPKQEPPS